MPDKAHVTSLDALDAFRANLIVYFSQARPALEEVAADVMRTRAWLENQQRSLWENQLRRRVKELERAQQSLFSARLGALRRETAADQMAVHRAKRAVEEAETKLRMIKKWLREFEGRVQPMVKQTEKLHTILTNDMVKAVAYLTQALDTLAAYAEIKPTAGMAIDTPPPSTNSTAVTTDPELGALVEHNSPETPAKGGSQ